MRLRRKRDVLKIKILGAGQQVGKAGVLVSYKGSNILLDYGVDVSGEEPDFPISVKPKVLDAIVLSHAHLDHSGALPLLYVSAEPRLYVNSLTMDIVEVLINDFLKISKYYVPYEVIELYAMKRNAININYREKIDLGKFSLKTYNAGHIQGSSLIEIDFDDHKVLYTGDFNLEKSCLLRGADIKPFKNADIVIMENTYSLYNHPNREENEKLFIDSLLEVLDNGGVVLIPSFAVGRSQEIMCVLAKYDVSYPIYLDGMARIISEFTLQYKEMIRNQRLFYKACSMVRKIKGWRSRKRAIKKPGIIISPAGMLKGGASVFYMEKVMDDPKNAVFFVSYQVESTPGRSVLQSGIFTSEKKSGIVKARVEWFDFSSHCGRNDLIDAIKATRKDAKIILIHGEKEYSEIFKKYVEENLEKEVYLPSNGEELTFQ